MSAANRRRGHNAEREVVKYLRAAGWPDACTTRSKLGHDGATAPGDIDVWPGICIEVKDVARSAFPSWCAQAVAEANGRIPVVVRRTRGVPDVGMWPARIPSAGWAALGALPETFDSHYCIRTETWWVRTTFGVLCELVREDAS